MMNRSSPISGKLHFFGVLFKFFFSVRRSGGAATPNVRASNLTLVANSSSMKLCSSWTCAESNGNVHLSKWGPGMVNSWIIILMFMLGTAKN